MRSKKTLFALVIALLGFLSWYLLNPSAPITVGSITPEPSTPTINEPSPIPAPEKAQETPAMPKNGKTQPAPGPERTGFAPWELKIDEALRSQAEHSTIAKVLLQQVPFMPPEGQHAAAQHITNLIADKDYLDVIPYIQNPKLADAFQEIVVSESLNRPKEVKLPVLLATARLSKHPMKETATSILSVLLDQNYGTDWAKWEAAVQEALKQP